MEEAKKPEEKKGQIFLQLPGVEGVSREKGYEGWLRAQTYQFGVGCGVSRGGGYGRRRRRAPPPTEGGDAPKEEEVNLINRFSAKDVNPVPTKETRTQVADLPPVSE